MTKKQLCEICTEYSTETKCDIEDTCELQNILQENTELKRSLKQIKKELKQAKKKLEDLEISQSWERNPERMGV